MPGVKAHVAIAVRQLQTVSEFASISCVKKYRGWLSHNLGTACALTAGQAHRVLTAGLHVRGGRAPASRALPRCMRVPAP